MNIWLVHADALARYQRQPAPVATRWAYLGGNAACQRRWQDVLGAASACDVALLRDAVAEEMRQDFCAWHDAQSERHAASVRWWLSPPASRFHGYSSLFESTCFLLTAERLVAEQSAALLVVESWGVLRELARRLTATGHSVRRVVPGCWDRLRSQGRKVAAWLRASVHAVRVRRIFQRELGPAYLPAGGTTAWDLLYLPFLSRSLAAEHYHDTHSLPGVAEWLHDQGRSLLIIPRTVDVNRQTAPELCRKLRTCAERFAWPELLCTWGDYARAALWPLRLLALRLRLEPWRGIAMAVLGRADLQAHCWQANGFMLPLYHALGRRLAERGIRPARLLGWWENQPLDRALVLGLRARFPELPILGYLGYVPNPNYLHFHPSPAEQVHGAGCDVYCPTGPLSGAELQQFAPALRLLPAPSFRYAYLWQPLTPPQRDHPHIGIILSIDFAEVVETLGLLLACRLAPGTTIAIRPHPVTPLDQLRALLPAAYRDCVVTGGTLASFAAPATVILSRGQTSALVEAVVAGCFVIIYRPATGLLLDPLAGSPPGCHAIVANQAELQQQLDSLRTPTMAQRQAVLAGYFYPDTPALRQNLLTFGLPAPSPAGAPECRRATSSPAKDHSA